jgi:cyclic-di-GMP-binding protein
VPSSEYSFDVVSQFDRQELVNAIDQAAREIATRYDLKNSGSSIQLDGESIRLASASEMTLDSVRDLLLQKAARRQLSLKIFDFGKVEEASRGTVRQTAHLRRGLNPDLAREVAKLVRDKLPKLKTQVQGDAVRVTGKNKDELQAAIKVLRAAEQERSWPVPLQFQNYR